MLKVFELHRKSRNESFLGIFLLLPYLLAPQCSFAATASTDKASAAHKTSQKGLDGFSEALRCCKLKFLSGETEEAMSALSKLRQEEESKHNNASLLSCLLSEAELNESQGNLSQAEPLLKRALSSALELGAQSPQYAQALASMASYHALKGDISSAREELEKAMAILKDKNADLEKSTAYLALARRQKAEGTFALADDAYKSALQLRDAHLKENDADSVLLCKEYAELLTKLDRKDEANKLKDRVNVAISTTFAEVNPIKDKRTEAGGQSAFRQAVGEARSKDKATDRNEAIKSWRTALETVNGKPGMEKQTAFALLHLADAYAAAQDFEQAQSLYKKALSIHESDGTDKSLAAARVLSRIAQRYTMEKRYTDSESLLKKAIEIEESSAADPRMLAASLQALVSAAMVNKDNNTAELAAKKLLAVSDKLPSETASNYKRTALATMGSLCMQTGRIQEGMKLMKELSSSVLPSSAKTGPELAKLYMDEYREIDRLIDEKQIEL